MLWLALAGDEGDLASGSCGVALWSLGELTAVMTWHGVSPRRGKLQRIPNFYYCLYLVTNSSDCQALVARLAIVLRKLPTIAYLSKNRRAYASGRAIYPQRPPGPAMLPVTRRQTISRATTTLDPSWLSLAV
jgi:hypothetical protein